MRKFLQSLKAGFAGLLLQSKQKIALKFKHMYKNLFDFVTQLTQLIVFN